MTISNIAKYLTSIENLVASVPADKGNYIQPALRNLGAVNIVLVREVISPVVFRNSDPETTDIEVKVPEGFVRAVRAVPNKFKHRERARGLQILREMDAGGKYPQNKMSVPKDAKIGEIFDLNSFVFGESTNFGSSVLPVKAAALYSDGLSVREYSECVGKTFHNRAAEDGSLFDALSKKNSSNIFDRHFVLPGTLMVQSISTLGKVMPVEALDHLLLSIGFGGAYGGQTSISGVNVKTHFAGIYASKVERPESSPYLLASDFLARGGAFDVEEVIGEIDAKLSPIYAEKFSHDDATAYVGDLMKRLETGEQSLIAQYKAAAEKMAELYQGWFIGKPE